MTTVEALDSPHDRAAAPQTSHAARLCSLMQEATATAFAIPVDELRKPSRCAADVAFARQCAMYLAHVGLGLSYSEIGRLFRRDRTTAAHACRLVEDRRDDPLLDRILQMIEHLCGDLMRCIEIAAQVRR
jgi:chromosomal replication initiation ATPase DnaA